MTGKKRKVPKGIRVVAASMAMVVVGSGAAFAATLNGTPAGETIRGTNQSDYIRGYGGADLIYAYGAGDNVYAGNEAGWGDKVLGGAGMDGLVGQQGDDALYGQGGSDRLDGQYGDDLLSGGAGGDVLNAGPGADDVYAQDGRRDFIELCGSGPGDVVYYDRGLDVFVPECPEPAAEEGARSGADGMSAAEAARETEAELTTEEPPEGLFEPHEKVLVEHKGEKLLVAEKRVEAHTGHGDEILDPTGRAGFEEDRR